LVPPAGFEPALTV